MSLAYFPLYADRYEADTTHLSMLEDGAYNRLLRLCWRSPGCKLPNDMPWIFRQLRAQSSEDQTAVTAVLDEYFTKGRGKIWSGKLLKVFVQVSVAHQNKSEAGKKGAAAKALKTKEPDASTAKAQLKQPEPEPEPEEEEKKDGGDGSAQGEILPDVQPVQNPTDREQILAAIGVDPISGLTGRGGQMIGNPADMVCARSWINDLGLTMPEIIEVIRDTMAKKTTGPPSVFKYFNESMQRLAAAKSAPALKPSEGNYDSRPANISSPAKSRPGDGSGTIAALAAVAARYAGRAQ